MATDAINRAKKNTVAGRRRSSRARRCAVLTKHSLTIARGGLLALLALLVLSFAARPVAAAAPS